MSETSRAAHSYIEALSGGDPDAVAGCVTEDFVNEHTSAIGSSCVGRAEYRERLPAFLGTFEDLSYEVVDTIAESNKASVRYRMRARFDGHDIDIPGVMLFEIRDGLVAKRTDVWDSLTFLRQTGGVEER